MACSISPLHAVSAVCVTYWWCNRITDLLNDWLFACHSYSHTQIYNRLFLKLLIHYPLLKLLFYFPGLLSIIISDVKSLNRTATRSGSCSARYCFSSVSLHPILILQETFLWNREELFSNPSSNPLLSSININWIIAAHERSCLLLSGHLWLISSKIKGLKGYHPKNSLTPSHLPRILLSWL